MYTLTWQPLATLPIAEKPSANFLPWIADATSFMQRLVRHGIAAPHVQVLSETWQLLAADEYTILGLAATDTAYVREVLIDSAEGQWMVARTVFTPALLAVHEERFTQLQNRSLGSVLFNDPAVTRTPFDVSRIAPATPWHEKVAAVANINADSLWARRSRFWVEKNPLLLTEIFLPALHTLAA